MYVYWFLFLDFYLSMRNRPEMQPIARFLSFAAINTAYKPKPYRMNYGVLGLSLTLIINTERVINLYNILLQQPSMVGNFPLLIAWKEKRFIVLYYLTFDPRYLRESFSKHICLFISTF